MNIIADMPDFFSVTAGLIGKLGISLAGREIGEKIKDTKTKRRMERMVEDAVDRIVEQVDGFLTGENVSEQRKEVLIASLCANLQTLVDNPQDFFVGNLDGPTIFKQRHPDGKLPEEICEEDLGHFYTVLFPQIAQFLAGSRVAIQQWQAEGYREEFKRLAQIAEEIKAINIKIADLPTAIVQTHRNIADKEADNLLREFSQTLLNTLLLRLDLSPLRAERALYGSLRDHFVIPAFRVRGGEAKPVENKSAILRALAEPGSRRIIHGGAGVGKTTWALWLQCQLLESEPRRLAVVIRLRESTEIESCSLLDLLKARAGVHLRDNLTENILRKWLINGQLVIVLDGFDEVPEGRRDAIEKWVNECSAIASNAAIIVTSRPLQSGHLGELRKPWQQWELLPFDQSRIIEFIERWHRYLPDGELSSSERSVDCTELAKSFFADPSLKPLSDTPLMLGTLLFVHHRDKKLPSGRVDLYERYIAAMLGLRDSGLGVQARATKLSDKDKRRVLSKIALYFHLNSVNEVNDLVMTGLVTNALIEFKLNENVDRLLPALSERTGLVQGPGAWSFMHKTIGEFLVAELVCEGVSRLPDGRRLDRKELWSQRHKDNWTAVLFFWAGKTSQHELEEFLIELLDEDSEIATSLALAILHDQGERLVFERQRFIALGLIRKQFPTETGSTYSCNSPLIPKELNYSLSCAVFPLRGISRELSYEAVTALFRREVLTPSDIAQSNQTIRFQLMMASLQLVRKASADAILAIRPHFESLGSRNLIIILFQYIVGIEIFLLSPLQSCRKAVERWLEVCPDGQSWCTLLLMGLAASAHPKVNYCSLDSASLAFLLLLEHLDNPIDDQCLPLTVECDSWPGLKHIDLLQCFQEVLHNEADTSLKIGEEQRAVLIKWNDALLERRSLL